MEELQGYPARFLTLMLRSAGWTEDKDAGEYRCHAEGEGVEADGMVLVTVKSGIYIMLYRSSNVII